MRLYNHNDEVEVKETVDLTEKDIIPTADMEDFDPEQVDDEEYVLEDDGSMSIEDDEEDMEDTDEEIYLEDEEV